MRQTYGYSPVIERDDIAIYQQDHGNGFVALRFVGRQSKPADHIRYRTAARREEAIREWIAGADNWARLKAERAQARADARANLGDTAPVGAIYTTSWGYDQTNVEAYEVTRVVSRTRREVRPIALRSDPHSGSGPMSDYVTPVPGEYVGEPFTVTMRPGDTFYPEGADHSFIVAHRREPGTRQYRSWYA